MEKVNGKGMHGKWETRTGVGNENRKCKANGNGRWQYGKSGKAYKRRKSLAPVLVSLSMSNHTAWQPLSDQFLNSSEQILQDCEIDRLGKVMIKPPGFRLPPVFLLAPAGQGNQHDIVELWLFPN